MKKLSRAEAAALAIALAVVLFSAGWFARGNASGGWFTVSGSMAEPLPSPAVSSFVPEVPVDLNTATLRDLMGLPGIGEARAQAILDYRAEHGPFRYVEDITRVSGIGQATFEGLEPYITVEGGDAP